MNTLTPTRPALRWHGGKWLLAPWIMGYFPKHEAYVEPFGGGASVLLRKPVARLEVYNDLDGEAVNLFRVLRMNPEDLAAAIEATPFARKEFEGAYQLAGCPVERARRMLIRSHMGFGSNAVHRRSGFRGAGLRAGVLPVHNWRDLPTVLRDVAERFRGVVIENRPAVDVMASNDGADVLHYIDPPYLFSTRGDEGRDYAYEMTLEDHAALLKACRKTRGLVVLSGYANEMYDEALPDWRRVTRATLADGARPRTEVLWINPACAAALDHGTLHSRMAADAG